MRYPQVLVHKLEALQQLPGQPVGGEWVLTVRQLDDVDVLGQGVVAELQRHVHAAVGLADGLWVKGGGGGVEVRTLQFQMTLRCTHLAKNMCVYGFKGI